MLIRITFILILLCVLVKPVDANSYSQPNNKVGIHLAQPSDKDIQAASDLVNSNGGDWGYVTLVIQENDRDLKKWQQIFDQLRKLHLIPLIRLATQPQGDVWKKPQKEDALSWANFLNSLNWVIKNRYIILFNEPNHGSEWGGRVDPEDYVETAFSFSKTLKEKNKNFFIMLAGFDASAPSRPPRYEDERIFIKQGLSFLKGNLQDKKQLFDLIDGWASHSYPRNYIGSVYGSGRRSVRTYQWELNLLKRLGIKKDLAVFITETGWKNNINPQQIKLAYQDVWFNDDKVKGVTPFLLNYQSVPFQEFSWRLQGGKDGFYPQYYLIQKMKKQKGEPEIVESGKISFNFPKDLVVSSNYHFQISLKNTGQGFWDKNTGYSLVAKNQSKEDLDYLLSDIKSIMPNEEKTIDFYFKTNHKTGNEKTTIFLEKDKKELFQGKEWAYRLLPLPSLKFKVKTYPKFKTKDDDFEIQIFGPNEQLVFKRKKIRVVKGKGIVDNIQNISFGQKHRLVILKPYYLPRQKSFIFKKEKSFQSGRINSIVFEPMIPIDFDKDGNFDFNDIKTLIHKPSLLKLFIP